MHFVERAMCVRRLIADDYMNVFRTVDLLLTPVTSAAAVQHSEFQRADGGYGHERADDYFTQSVNMAGEGIVIVGRSHKKDTCIPGCCAISVPIRLSHKGLPLSLQLIGPSHGEQTLFRVAR